MIRRSGTASMSPMPSPMVRWPLTAAAWAQLDAELIHQKAEVDRLATSGPDETSDAPDHLIELPLVQAGRRLERLRGVLADAAVSDRPDRAVIGRCVTLREEDGSVVTYTLVLPGEGDPARGWISADSPLGSAILNCRAGDTVEIDAPGGRRRVVVESVSDDGG